MQNVYSKWCNVVGVEQICRYVYIRYANDEKREQRAGQNGVWTTLRHETLLKHQVQVYGRHLLCGEAHTSSPAAAHKIYMEFRIACVSRALTPTDQRSPRSNFLPCLAWSSLFCVFALAFCHEQDHSTKCMNIEHHSVYTYILLAIAVWRAYQPCVQTLPNGRQCFAVRQISYVYVRCSSAHQY